MTEIQLKTQLIFLKGFNSVQDLKLPLTKYIGTLSPYDYCLHGLSWIKTPLETLGITICDNAEISYKQKFQERISNLKSILNVWKGRKLSLNNNLALAPLIYVSNVINTPAKAINEISNLFQNVLWNGSTSKISQKNTDTTHQQRWAEIMPI